jgi:hypothetical protein
VNAISVWDHRPSPDELLAARLADGWRPTPTGTVDGDRVLGHACKVMRRE